MTEPTPGPEPAVAGELRAEDVTAAAIHDGRPTLAARIAAAMAEAGEVTKSDENREQGYKFASAESILKAVREPLLARGVLLFPNVESLEEHEITSKSGTKGTRVVIEVTYKFTDGRDELVARWQGEGQDYGDKAYGKAYTNALKTFIRSAWLLPTEHDDPEARPSGDRVAAGATAELPAWAKPAGRDRIAQADALVPVLGQARTRAVFAAVKGSLGEVPDIVVNTAKLLAAQYAAALEELGLHEAAVRERTVLEEQAAKDAADRAQAEEAQAAAEAPDAPPADEGPSTGIAGDHSEGLEAGEEELARAELELDAPPPPPPSVDVAPRPPAGTVPVDLTGVTGAGDAAQRLREEGCSCPDPLAAGRYEQRAEEGDEAGAKAARALVDSDCPIVGHGIAF